MKKIAVLGSTGSIGTQTLEIVRNNPDLQVVALAAGSSVDLMEAQIREFTPMLAAMWSEEAAADLRNRVADLPVKVVAGMEGLLEIAVMPESQVLVTAIVGMIGIRPTIAAIEAGKDIALANKETLVTAGHIIMPLAKEKGISILPVDSEHSAIFQSLNGEPANRISKILLTASGGPFRGYTLEQLENVTLEQALKHPKWTMGSKITIDSATMMNKGLEIIEARWLFGTPGEKIQVVVHPESIIHSMVEYADGSVIAQMGHPDMREAIQFAFSFPHRLTLDNRKLNFAELGSMSFFAPDMENFPALSLAYEALAKGGNMACVMNAANEAAVAAFLQERIGFYDITDIVADCMAGADFAVNPDLDTIFKTNEETLAKAAEKINLVAARRTV